jgi:hypothetical protein
MKCHSISRTNRLPSKLSGFRDRKSSLVQLWPLKFWRIALVRRNSRKSWKSHIGLWSLSRLSQRKDSRKPAWMTMKMLNARRILKRSMRNSRLRSWIRLRYNTLIKGSQNLSLVQLRSLRWRDLWGLRQPVNYIIYLLRQLGAARQAALKTSNIRDRALITEMKNFKF